MEVTIIDLLLDLVEKICVVIIVAYLVTGKPVPSKQQLL